jgi:adenylate kinase
LVKERLARSDVLRAYILDGFPRTIAQAAALEMFSPPDMAIDFDIPDDNVVERLRGRVVCRKCGFSWHIAFNPPTKSGICDKCGGELYTRDDDRPEAIKKRLEVYREQTEPLISFYRGKGLLLDIDARPHVDEVFSNFKKVIGV